MSSHGPLRVAFFGNFLSASLGGRGASEDVADRLQARGASVVRASRHLAPGKRLFDMLRLAVSERARYDVAHVDVLSGRGFIWAESVCAMLRLLRKPYVLTLHGGGLPQFAAGRARRVRRLLDSARLVVAPSRYLSESMRAYRPDIRVNPNAIDVGRYYPRLREAVGPKLIWLRSFHAIYNPPLAVQVLAALSTRFPDVTLVMAGPDKGDGTREATLAEASRLGVRQQLSLTGNVANETVPLLLSKHDILINTSNIDNTPVSLIEAMATGLCIVTTDVGGIPALCRHRQTALLVPPADPAAMAAACAALIDDPSLARALSARGMVEARAFDHAAVSEQWEEILWTAQRPHHHTSHE